MGALIYTQIKSRGRFVRPIEVANGILGALVSITASCACVQTYESLIIGFIGSFIVHAVAGCSGVLTVGLFADASLPGIQVDNGLFRGGGFRQLGVQFLEVVVIMGWSAVCVPTFFYVMGIAVSRDWRNPRAGLRVATKEEITGTDKYLHDCNTGTTTRPSASRRSSNTIMRSLEGVSETEPEDSSNRTVTHMRDYFAKSKARAHKKADRVLFLPRSASDSDMFGTRQSAILPYGSEEVGSKGGSGVDADGASMSSRSVDEP